MYLHTSVCSLIYLEQKYKTACDLCYHWLLSRYNIINERGELSNDIEEAMNRADDVKQALVSRIAVHCVICIENILIHYPDSGLYWLC